MLVVDNLGVFKKISEHIQPVCGNQISYFKTKHCLFVFLTISKCLLCINLTRPQAQIFHNIKFRIKPKELLCFRISVDWRDIAHLQTSTGSLDASQTIKTQILPERTTFLFLSLLNTLSILSTSDLFDLVHVNATTLAYVYSEI